MDGVAREQRQRLKVIDEELEAAADEARAVLSKRRVTLDKVETITAFAQDMSEYLKTGELTESRAFIRSFVRETEVALGRGVRSTGVSGGPPGTRTLNLLIKSQLLCQIELAAPSVLPGVRPMADIQCVRLDGPRRVPPSTRS